MIRRLTGKRADLLAEEVIKAMAEMKEKVKTITFDNDLEFPAHESIAEGLESDIYFAHPYASWERGINENTNGLIRQYFPKDTNFNEVTDGWFVVDRLNSRPRATRISNRRMKCFGPEKTYLLHKNCTYYFEIKIY